MEVCVAGPLAFSRTALHMNVVVLKLFCVMWWGLVGELCLYADDDYDVVYEDFGEQGINVTAADDIIVGGGLLIWDLYKVFWVFCMGVQGHNWCKCSPL